MAIKDLLVAFDGSDAALNALKYATQMASKYDATLTAIHVYLPMLMDQRVARWVGEDVLITVKEAQRERLQSIEDAFRRLLQDLDFKGEIDWIAEEGYPNEILSEAARYYDILLLGQHGADPQKNRRVRAEELVMVAGKPMIVVPSGYEVRPFKEYAVIAWDGGSRSARALSDAMQILETKSRLDVLSIGKKPAMESGASDRNILRHLNRHGIYARHVVIPAGADGVGATLLDYCRENEPDVLVMGAYGHARLREDLFGGVTRDVLRTSPLPVLISH